jgi:hypothetical protein
VCLELNKWVSREIKVRVAEKINVRNFRGKTVEPINKFRYLVSKRDANDGVRVSIYLLS